MPSGIGRIGVGYRDSSRDVFELAIAQRHGGQDARTAGIGFHRITDLVDGAIQDVGTYLAPQAGIGAAAHHVNVGQFAVDEFFHMGHQPARIVGHAFHHGAHQGAAVGFQGEVVETAAHQAVFHRGALAIQPGGENQPPAAGRDFPGQGFQRGKTAAALIGGRFAAGREENVVPQKGQAAPGGFLFVGDEIPPGDGGRNRGHIVQQVGLFERHVAGQPGGGADIEMGFVIPDRTGADGRRVEVGCSHDHRQAGRQSEGFGGIGKQGTQDVHGSFEIGQGCTVQSGHAKEPVMVVDAVDVPVVGHPVEDDRVGGGGKAACQLEIEVVLGLQEFMGGGIEFRFFMLEKENVGDGILAGRSRNAARQADPLPEFVDAEPLQAHRT